MSVRIPLGCVVQVTTLLLSLWLEAETFQGRIAMVSEDKLILAMTNEQRTVVVKSDTSITLDGKPAKMNQLAAGNRAMIVAEKAQNAFVAKSIAAMSVK
jgi:hypothetical protein